MDIHFFWFLLRFIFFLVFHDDDSNDTKTTNGFSNPDRYLDVILMTLRGRKPREFNENLPEGMYCINLHKWLPGDFILDGTHFFGLPQGKIDAYSQQRLLEDEKLWASTEGLPQSKIMPFNDRQWNHFRALGKEDKYEEVSVKEWFQRVFQNLNWWQVYFRTIISEEGKNLQSLSWSMISKEVKRFLMSLNLQPAPALELHKMNSSAIQFVKKVYAMPFYLEYVGPREFTLQCMEYGHPYFGHFLSLNSTTSSLNLTRKEEAFSLFRIYQASSDEFYYLQVEAEPDSEKYVMVDGLFDPSKATPSVSIVPNKTRKYYPERTSRFRIVEATEITFQYRIINKLVNDYPYLLPGTVHSDEISKRLLKYGDDNEVLTRQFVRTLQNNFPGHYDAYQEFRRQVDESREDDVDNDRNSNSGGTVMALPSPIQSQALKLQQYHGLRGRKSPTNPIQGVGRGKVRTAPVRVFARDSRTKQGNPAAKQSFPRIRAFV